MPAQPASDRADRRPGAARPATPRARHRATSAPSTPSLFWLKLDAADLAHAVDDGPRQAETDAEILQIGRRSIITAWVEPL